MWIPDNKQCLSHCQSECKRCLLLGQIHNSTRQRCSHLIAFYKLPTLLAPITIKQIHVPDAFPKQRWALANQSVLQWPCIAQAFPLSRHWHCNEQVSWLVLLAVLGNPFIVMYYLEPGHQDCPSLLQSSEGSWPGYAYQGWRKPGSLFLPAPLGWLAG